MRNADTVRGLNRGIGRPLHRYTSLESGVMRKYHAPFGGRPTEKGSNQEYLAGGPPYLVPSWYLVNPSNWRPDERGRLCAQQQRRCDCPHGRQKRTSAIGTGGNEPS